MAKTARIELRVEPDLKARVETEAGRRGQKVVTFVERALEKALTGETPRPSPAGREAKSEADHGPARPAPASRQGASRPSASPRTSSAVKANVRPIPKTH